MKLFINIFEFPSTSIMFVVATLTMSHILLGTLGIALVLGIANLLFGIAAACECKTDSDENVLAL